uniref:Uncharacterized protein n=1 Tax=Trypanosoma congolense (strain IL3000) TaxID=1068625 RepID=G0UXZ7_TRYCI|nr:conserved hypothetical protein [Trypanosoma congolense IL3000]
MAGVVVHRFRECQNLLDSMVVSLGAIGNFNSQRTCVEEAARRGRCSCAFAGASVPRCCADPLGMLVAFPETTLELVIAQHDSDIAALLQSLNSAQQTWGTKLQQAKEALQPKRSEEGVAKTALSEQGNASHSLGVYTLVAVLAQMHGWLRGLVFALRADLVNPPQAVQLSALLGEHSMQGRPVEYPPVSMSLEVALQQLPERVRREWELYKKHHLMDEARLMLAV